MTINRHFEMVYMLLNKKTTAKELAEHFEVSTRTIYRDIDTLSAARIPVYSSKGKGGGISLLDDYVFDSSLLTEQEKIDILMALQSLTATNYPEVDDILNKLSVLFKQEKSNWIEVDFSSWGSSPNQKESFALIRKAIVNSYTLSFRYYNAQGNKSDRIVEPNRLLFKHKAWYLYGYCTNSKAFRNFKVNRMKNIVCTYIHFEIKKDSTALANTDSNELVAAIELRLTISAAGAYRVFDEFSEMAIHSNDDGSFDIVTRVPGGSWLISYLLSFGSLLEQIEPEHIREQVLLELDLLKRNLHFKI